MLHLNHTSSSNDTSRKCSPSSQRETCRAGGANPGGTKRPPEPWCGKHIRGRFKFRGDLEATWRHAMSNSELCARIKEGPSAEATTHSISQRGGPGSHGSSRRARRLFNGGAVVVRSKAILRIGSHNMKTARGTVRRRLIFVHWCDVFARTAIV